MTSESSEIPALREENKALRVENQWLKEENSRLRRALYGTKSEQAEKAKPATENATATDGLIQEEEVEKKATEPDASKTKQAGNGAGRRPPPEHLPRERRVFDLTGDDRRCPCGCDMVEIGEECSEQVSVVPTRYIVFKNVKKKYACRSCGRTVRTAKAPPSIIPGSTYGSAEFCAHVVTSKCQFSIPNYRMEAMMNEQGIPIDRTTLDRMMETLGDKCLPIWLLMRDELMSQDICCADETTFQVLKEPTRPAQTDSWLWQYRSSTHATNQAVLFEYQETRSGEHPKQFFDVTNCEVTDASASSRYLQVDGYSGYNCIKNVTRVGCWAHARRKFVEAMKAIPIDQQRGSLAMDVVEMIKGLFAIERKIATKSPEEKYLIRQAQSKTILDKIKAWLDLHSDQVIPKSLIGKAVGYAINQWETLIVFVEDGRLAIDNNLSEREIKSFVIGRKNFLFADHPESAQSLAILYSLVRSWTVLSSRCDSVGFFDQPQG
jgi:transposase